MEPKANSNGYLDTIDPILMNTSAFTLSPQPLVGYYDLNLSDEASFILEAIQSPAKKNRSGITALTFPFRCSD